MSLPLPPSGEQIEIVHGDQRAWVVEVGGALRTYRVNRHEVLDGYGAAERCTDARGQSLIPWPNRLRNGSYRFAGEERQLPLSEPARRNAIHGLVRWSSFAVAHRESDRVTMRHVLHPRDGYPFMLRIEIDYSLSAAGLAVTTTATNVGAERCPFGAGAHPYIAAGTPRIDPATLRAPGRTRLLADERGIPTGAAPTEGGEHDFRIARTIGATVLDTAYTDLERGADGRAVVELAAADDGVAVSVWLDETYSYVMLFTGDSLPEPERRRRSLGVEPMTCAPDAFRSGDGLLVLEPGESHTGSWGITCRHR
ncbi:MAG TPA: aldose 1-epimerase family protein [Gaiellales bacterium]|jgi:aldose 1-epimerase